MPAERRDRDGGAETQRKESVGLLCACANRAVNQPKPGSRDAIRCPAPQMKQEDNTVYKTRTVAVGPLALGGDNPVWVQSMTNTDTADVPATLAQIRQLAEAGCDIVRVSVYNEACAKAVRDLVDASPVPLVADIHFDHRLALLAMENGIHKLRINPGNIGGEKNVQAVADCAKAHHVPIRIGVNSGSIEREILARDGGPTARGMVDSALNHARMLEKAGFGDIVLSMKASDVRLTIEAYELAAASCDYPLHVGVTEAGLPGQGTIKSAIGIGALLARGIGNTIRVSLTGSPIPEGKAAWDILRALNLRTQGVQLVSCPTCGRTAIDVAGIAARVEKELADVQVPLKVAVMGCVVNGPGEAREADIGIAGGKGCGALFRKGQEPVKVEGDLAEILIREARKIAATKTN